MRRGRGGARRPPAPSTGRRTTAPNAAAPPGPPPHRATVPAPRRGGGGLVPRFTADDSVDEARMRALVERQIEGGVKLLVPCGTTGEGATLTAEEQTRVIRIAVEAGRGRARVIAGVGTNSTAVAIERAQAARVTGADAVLVVAPYYNKPTQAGLTAHFTAAAAAAPGGAPLLVNSPGGAAADIHAPPVLRPARGVENIVRGKGAPGGLSPSTAVLRD